MGSYPVSQRLAAHQHGRAIGNDVLSCVGKVEDLPRIGMAEPLHMVFVLFLLTQRLAEHQIPAIAADRPLRRAPRASLRLIQGKETGIVLLSSNNGNEQK
jgi:hypothetical protein